MVKKEENIAPPKKLQIACEKKGVSIYKPIEELEEVCTISRKKHRRSRKRLRRRRSKIPKILRNLRNLIPKRGPMAIFRRRSQKKVRKPMSPPLGSLTKLLKSKSYKKRVYSEDSDSDEDSHIPPCKPNISKTPTPRRTSPTPRRTSPTPRRTSPTPRRTSMPKRAHRRTSPPPRRTSMPKKAHRRRRALSKMAKKVVIKIQNEKDPQVEQLSKWVSMHGPEDIHVGSFVRPEYSQILDKKISEIVEEAEYLGEMRDKLESQRNRSYINSNQLRLIEKRLDELEDRHRYFEKVLRNIPEFTNRYRMVTKDANTQINKSKMQIFNVVRDISKTLQKQQELLKQQNTIVNAIVDEGRMPPEGKKWAKNVLGVADEKDIAIKKLVDEVTRLSETTKEADSKKLATIMSTLFEQPHVVPTASIPLAVPQTIASTISSNERSDLQRQIERLTDAIVSQRTSQQPLPQQPSQPSPVYPLPTATGRSATNPTTHSVF